MKFEELSKLNYSDLITLDQDELLHSFPPDWNKMHIAKWLYNKVGEYFYYDEQWILTPILDKSPDEKGKIIKEIIYNTKGDTGICITLADACTRLFQKVGIDAITVIRDSDNILLQDTSKLGELKRADIHGFCLFTIDGNTYCADLTRNDLINTKQGFETSGFATKLSDKDLRTAQNQTGIKDLSTLSAEELKTIDDKIGYTYGTDSKEYSSDTIKLLSHELDLISLGDELTEEEKKEGIELREELGISNLDGKDLFDYKINFLLNYINSTPFDNWHCIEKSTYFSNLMRQCMKYSEFSEYYSEYNHITCAMPQGNGNDKYMRTFIAMIDKNSNKRTIYDFNGSDKACEISQDEIRQLFNNGMTILSNSLREQHMKTLIGYPTKTMQEAVTGALTDTAVNTSTITAVDKTNKELNNLDQQHTQK